MSALADRAVAHVAHLHDGSESDQLLEALTRALLDPAALVSLVAHGDGDQVGPWHALTDPAVAPLALLPHAGLYTGGVMPPRIAGESDTDYEQRARQELVYPRGMLRATSAAIRIAARPYTTGQQTIRIVERPDDDWRRVQVISRPSETPDEDALEAAINADDVIPFGMRAELTVTDAPLINEGTLAIDDVDVSINTATLDDVT